MAYGRYYKTAFVVGWLANLALWLLVVFVLIETLLAKTPPPLAVILTFSAFGVLFVLFSISFGLFLRSHGYSALILTIVFIIGQFLCVLITTVTLFADDRIIEEVRFEDDPTVWIQNRRWLPIAFSIVFLPLFLIQIFVLNRYAQWINENDAADPKAPYERKRTPYHHQKQNISTITVS